MGRKHPYQRSSTFPALVSAPGLPGCGAPSSQARWCWGCSGEGTRAAPAKAELHFWWPAGLPAPSRDLIHPPSPEGTSQRDMPLGRRFWGSTGHGWLQDVWLEQGGHIHTETSPPHVPPHAGRPLHVSSPPHPWINPNPEAPIQLWARAQHPRGVRSLTQMRKGIPPVASSEPPTMPKEQVGIPVPSSPHPFSCSGTAPQPRLRSLAGC